MDSLNSYSTYTNLASSANTWEKQNDFVPYNLKIPESSFGFEDFGSRSGSHSYSVNSSTNSSPTAVNSLRTPTAPNTTSTLFVGDISYAADEERVKILFSAYGRVESVHLKKSDFNKNRTHLGYGFVKFDSPMSAVTAFRAMNGQQFLGRTLRLGFAEDYHPQAHPHQPYVPFRHHMDRNGQGKLNSAQLYVTFATSNLALAITELTLRELFGQYGELQDVVIKQVEVNQGVGIQSGYGFVHFPLTEMGIQSASRAVEHIHNQTIGWIRYQCRFSHGLKKLLGALSLPVGPTAMAPPAPRPASSFSPSNRPALPVYPQARAANGPMTMMNHGIAEKQWPDEEMMMMMMGMMPQPPRPSQQQQYHHQLPADRALMSTYTITPPSAPSPREESFSFPRDDFRSSNSFY